MRMVSGATEHWWVEPFADYLGIVDTSVELLREENWALLFSQLTTLEQEFIKFSRQQDFEAAQQGNRSSHRSTIRLTFPGFFQRCEVLRV